MEKEMETVVLQGLGSCWDNGKEHGNYKDYVGIIQGL